MIAEGLLAIVVVAIVALVTLEVTVSRVKMSNTGTALILVTLGTMFVLEALQLWIALQLQVLQIGGRAYIAIFSEDFVKVVGAFSMGTIGMSLITGGLALISGGKYELRLSSTEPVSAIEIKRN